MKRQKHVIYKRIIALGMAFVFGLLLISNCVPVYADEKEIVIVIDPGHGGTQNGAEYNGILEKDINIKVSEAFARELSKYDGVKVYLTHETADKTMSIKARVDFAEKVKADYFFCVHFNASGNHNFYGAETWITSFGRYYSEMYAFSDILLQEFEELGLFNRGIKTKLETDGTDYYGVLRRGAESDIPAVIIEHCHMDNMVDAPFLNDAMYETFGKTDAKAVAQFLKLKSSQTGEDYSGFEYELPPQPKEPIPNDTTPPSCNVKVTQCNVSSKKIFFQITSKDEEQPILYYGYSLDGGKSYTPLEVWEKDTDTMEVVLEYEDIRDKKILFKTVNGFNLEGLAKEISIDEMVLRQEAITATEEASLEAALKEIANSRGEYVEPLSGGTLYLIIALAALAGALIITVVIIFIFLKKKDTPEHSN